MLDTTFVKMTLNNKQIYFYENQTYVFMVCSIAENEVC